MKVEMKDYKHNRLTMEIELEEEEITKYKQLCEWMKSDIVANNQILTDNMADYGVSWSNDILGFINFTYLTDAYDYFENIMSMVQDSAEKVRLQLQTSLNILATCHEVDPYDRTVYTTIMRDLLIANLYHFPQLGYRVDTYDLADLHEITQELKNMIKGDE